MCNCDFADSPTCFKQVARHARKPHKCCECRREIPAGASYEYVSGIWDGEPSSFKTCLKCVGLRAAHIAGEKASEPNPWDRCQPIYGELLQQIGECCGEDPNYLAAFRKARRSEIQP